MRPWPHLTFSCSLLWAGLYGCGPSSTSPAVSAPETLRPVQDSVSAEPIEAEELTAAEDSDVRIEALDGDPDSVWVTDVNGRRPAMRVARPDLNADGKPEELVRFHEDCGNWGECRMAIYAETFPEGASDASALRSLFKEEYVFRLEVGLNRHDSYADLYEIVRADDQGEPRMQLRVWRYDGERYVGQTPSELRASHPDAERARFRPGEEGYEDALCDSSGLPALSEDGTEVAVVRCRWEYDDSFTAEFQVISVATGATEHRVTLAQRGSGGEPALSPSARRQAAAHANRWLERGSFVPLPMMLTPGSDRPVSIAIGESAVLVAARETSRTEVRVDGELRWTGTSPGFPTVDYCCNPDGEPHQCEVPAHVTEAWATRDGELLVTKVENFDGADGCETGPRYDVRQLSVPPSSVREETDER